MNECRTSTRMFKKKVWLSIDPKGLVEYTDDALEVKPTTLKYLIKKSDIFEDDEALIMNERMLCGQGAREASGIETMFELLQYELYKHETGDFIRTPRCYNITRGQQEGKLDRALPLTDEDD
ncbi:MAG: hypothetical protein Q9180_005694 [Flavoplaca navasiana]